MNRLVRALRPLLMIAALAGLLAPRAVAAPTISNAEVIAVHMSDGSEAGTEKTWFVFRATVTPSQGNALLAPPAAPNPYRDPGSSVSNPTPNVPFVYINLFDPAHPEVGGQIEVAMRRDATQGRNPATDFVAFVRGSTIAGGAIDSRGRGVPVARNWSIAANETGNQPQNATSAVGNIAVYPSTFDTGVGQPAISIYPIAPDGSLDKAPGPGQNGNGLRTDPEDSTAPNDGGGATQFTWRVKVTTLSGLPPQVWTTNYDPWNYPTDARMPLIQSGVILVLTGPGQGGTVRLCPMEIEPGQAVTATNLYTTVGGGSNLMQHPTLPGGASPYKNGVIYRYTVLPTEYTTTPFGGDLQDMTPLFTAPDGLPAQVQGGQVQDLVGRPYGNVYASFGQLDAILYFAMMMSPPPPLPFYTQAQGRVGEYRYYYATSLDYRPDNVPWSGANNLNFTVSGWNPDDPNTFVTQYRDTYSRNPSAYSQLADSDDPSVQPGWPGDTSWANQYKHPFVTPILSDGHWTDDLIDNRRLQMSPAFMNETPPPYSAANAVSGNARRSRVTTQTRVRFQVRVFHTLPGGGQTPITVRLWLGTAQDGTMQPHTMQVEPNQPQPLDYTRGVVYYYDTVFPKGQEGFKSFYYDADDGTHRAIWPRRPLAANDITGRFEDPQATALPARSEPVLFGRGVVGKNYTLEPWVNHKPVLSNPSVTPTSGVEGQQYTYSVTYTDADNDLPLDAWVVLDNDPVNRRYRMTRDTATAGNSPSQGIRYQLVLSQLPANLLQKHNYYFLFRDNWATDVAHLRREYGEWVTLPQGDDSGNPSGWIDGPTIVGNRLPQLTNPSFSSSDQANNTATKHDLFVTYSDPDNDPPAYVKVFVDVYQTATNTLVSALPDAGTNMVRVNSTTPNWVVGEQFHLPSTIRLPYPGDGNEYRFRFQTSDGKGPVGGLPPEVTEITVGDGSASLSMGTTRVLTRVADAPPTYVDSNNTRMWDTDPTTLYVWIGDGANAVPAPAGTYSIDALRRSLVFNQASDPGSATVRVSYRYQQVVGPPVGQNHAPTLGPTPDGVGKPDVNYLTCVPLQGDPTTPFVFTIVYTDQDNQPPVMDDGNGNQIQAVKLVINGGGVHPLLIHPDDAKQVSIDYRKGIRFTGTVTLPVGKYSYHFEASDGALEGRFPLPAPAAGPYELPGPNVEDIGTLSDPVIAPFPKGTSNQIYQFTVTYKNASGLPPAVPIELHVWDSSGTTLTKLPMNLIDNPPDYKAGARYQNAGLLTGVQTATAEQPLSWGTHRITFGFQDRQYSVPTVPADQLLTVNAPPVLSDPAPTQFVTPNPAPRSATVTFAVKYSDLNGDPPVDPSTGAPRIAVYVADKNGVYVRITNATLTPDPKSFPEFPATTDQKIVSGQVFTWSMLAKDLPDSSVTGTRNVMFTAIDDFGELPVNPAPPAGDGLPQVRLVVPNGLTIGEGGLPSLQGPTIGQGSNDGTVAPAIGTTATPYVYSVIYRHDLGTAPATLTLKLYEGATLVKTLNLSDFQKTGTDYTAGVTYTYTTTAGLFNPGNHSYVFEASDGTNNVSLPQSGQFTGPYVNFPPALSNGQVVVIHNGVPGAPSTIDPSTGFFNPAAVGSVKDVYQFSVTYKDSDGTITPPSYVKIVSPNHPDLDGVVLTPPAGPYDYNAGVVYTSAQLTLTPGSKQFHFVAADRTAAAPNGVELDTVRFPTAVEATKLKVNSSIQLYGPDQNDAIRQGTLSPISGGVTGSYDFKVVYKHDDGTLPTSITVMVFDASGTTLIGTFPLVAINPANPTDTQIKAGVLYGVTVQGSQIQAGPHKYSFFASDGVATAQLPDGTDRFDGPTINRPPTLSQATAYVFDPNKPGGPDTPSTVDANNNLTPPVTGAANAQFVFRVTYADPDGVPPTSSGYVRVVVSGVQNPIVMHPKATPADYTGPVVYETAPQTLTAGAKTFHFEASDGFDPALLPASGDISGLTVSSLPVLSAPAAGTVVPASGPLSTTFTFQILYQDADNTPPASVQLVLDGDTANPLTMTKVGTSTDYVTGVVYSYAYRFPKTTTARSHTYQFTAASSALPALPVTAGPYTADLLNTAKFVTTPSSLPAGAVGSTYTITGQLVTAPALSASDNRAVRVQLVRPDGSGLTDNITVNVDGTFSYTTSVTLDSTGDWTARLLWDGVPSKFDSLSGEFPFKVKLTSLQINLPGSALNMISSPLVPANADPNSIYNPLDANGNPVGVGVLDMQAWTSGTYVSFNTDANFPRLDAGRGVWVKPKQSVVLSPQGKVWDKTQPFVLSVPVGWSMIGPVSLQPLPWSGVKVRYQGTEMNLTDSNSPLRPYAWTYDRNATGAYKPYKLIQANDVLTPGQAYWVRALAPCEIVLPAASRSVAVTRVADPRPTSLQIVAQTKTSLDTDNFVVLDGAARSRMAPVEKPPYLGEYVSVQMLPANTIKPSEVGRMASTDDVVGFEVTTNQKNTDVTVSFPNVAAMGRRYSVTVVDVSTGVRRSLNTAGTFTYSTGDNAAPRRFALIIRHATQNGRLVISAVRTTGRSAGSIALSYSLSADATVQIDVLDSTGEAIRSLNQGRAATAGANSVLWDGRNGNGVAMPAGTYVLRLKATDADGNTATYSHPVVLIR